MFIIITISKICYFSELTKINTFYSEKLAEATRKFAALKSELSCQYDHHNPNKSDGKLFRLKKQIKRPKDDKLPPTRKLQDLKLAFSEYYLSLVLLQNYQNLNFTGMTIIAKFKSNRVITNIHAPSLHQNYISNAVI